MSPGLEAAAVGLISFGIKEWIAWNERKARAAEWKPKQADVDEFIAEIAGDTPENVRARVAAQLGVPWPPAPPVAPG